MRHVYVDTSGSMMGWGTEFAASIKRVLDSMPDARVFGFDIEVVDYPPPNRPEMGTALEPVIEHAKHADEIHVITDGFVMVPPVPRPERWTWHILGGGSMWKSEFPGTVIEEK